MNAVSQRFSVPQRQRCAPKPTSIRLTTGEHTASTTSRHIPEPHRDRLTARAKAAEFSTTLNFRASGNDVPNPETERAVRAVLAGEHAAALESETLDFKEDARDEKATMKVLVDAALCFANAAGGTIVLGVRDSASGPEAIRGTSLSPDVIKSRIFQQTRPQLLVDVHYLPVRVNGDEKQLAAIRVPQSPEIHSDTKGRAPLRVGTDCLPMDPSQQARAREERRGVDWSANGSGRRASDISEQALTLARQRLGAFSDERRELATLSAPDLLRALGLVHRGELLRAGELLFAQRRNGSAPLFLYQYRGTPGGEPVVVERLDGPLVLAFDSVMQLIHARRQLTPLTLPDGQQIPLEDFPELAVREALGNAAIHRDYHLDAPVVIEHSPEVFVVSSPGPLVTGVTPRNILTHPSKPRNRALARAARVLGLAEEVGRGVDRMYREMIRAGRQVPTIRSTLQTVRVTLVGGAPNTQLARFVARLPDEERDDVDTMLLLVTMLSRRTVDAVELAPVLQKSIDEAEAVLRRLTARSARLLEATRESARREHPRYRLRTDVLQALGSAVQYKRRTMDQIDEKIIEHVHEYGKVTNRTVRNLLDVKTARAADILADLVRRELLVKTSRAQRGPSVEYGPGAKFPSRAPVRRHA